MAINLNRYSKFKQTKHYEIYLEKEPMSIKQRQVLIHYFSNNRWMQCTLSDSLFKMFFKPEEYKQVYMVKSKQRES